MYLEAAVQSASKRAAVIQLHHFAHIIGKRVRALDEAIKLSRNPD